MIPEVFNFDYYLLHYNIAVYVLAQSLPHVSIMPLNTVEFVLFWTRDNVCLETVICNEGLKRRDVTYSSAKLIYSNKVQRNTVKNKNLVLKL